MSLWRAKAALAAAETHPQGQRTSSFPSDRELKREMAKHRKGRAYHWRAQKHPKWAIKKAVEGAYEAGKELADLYRGAISNVEKHWKRGLTVFLHGRDAEALYEVLRRTPLWGRYKNRTVYAITSGSLLSQTNIGKGADYLRYLERLLPKNEPAVHIDTCCVGSAPDRMKHLGWNVVTVQLICTSADADLDRQMPETAPFCPDTDSDEGPDLFDWILETLEKYSPFHEIRGWGEIRYVPQATLEFWAHVYGILDELGLPRKPLGPHGRRSVSGQRF